MFFLLRILAEKNRSFK